MAKAKKNLDYTKVAQNIIANIGGKENVNSVRHCITRVRFKLKDESKADDNVVKSLEGVLSVVHGGGEYMVVIGDAVGDVYDAVCAQLGNITDSGSSEESKEKVNPVMKLLTIVVGAVGPCLNFICAGGIIKGLLTLLEMTGLVQSGSGIDTLISAAGDAVFFFLPVFLGMNLAKTLKGDQFLGAVIGAILCYPAINGTDLVILGMNFNYTYTSSFLPVVAVVAVAVPLAKALKKVIPKAVSNFLTPAITLLVVAPLGYAIIGPVVSMVGNLVNTGITALMSSVPLVAGAVFGGLYQVLVLFGVHQAVTSFSFMNLLAGSPDYIMAIGCTVSFAQCGVVLAMYRYLCIYSSSIACLHRWKFCKYRPTRCHRYLSANPAENLPFPSVISCNAYPLLSAPRLYRFPTAPARNDPLLPFFPFSLMLYLQHCHFISSFTKYSGGNCRSFPLIPATIFASFCAFVSPPLCLTVTEQWITLNLYGAHHMYGSTLSGFSNSWGISATSQPVPQLRVALRHCDVSDAVSQRLAGTDQNEKFFCPRDPGIEHIPLQHHIVGHQYRHDYDRIFRTLGLMDRGGVGQRQLVQFCHIVFDHAVIKQDGERPILKVNLLDPADVPVENLLIVVVLDLHDPVVQAVGQPAPT